MFVEVLVGVLALFLFINLVISWINLNLQLELKDDMVEAMQNLVSGLPNSSSNMNQVVSQINDIQNFLSELMQVMGNPFQMLAATHGARILDRIFPPKVEPTINRGGGDLLPASPSEEAWQEENRQENEVTADAQPESN